MFRRPPWIDAGWRLRILVPTTPIKRVCHPLSSSVDPYRRNFTVGQEGDDLIVRIRTPLTGDNGIRPELTVPDVFSRPEKRSLVITYRESTAWVFVDAVEAEHTFPLVGILVYAQRGLVLAVADHQISSEAAPDPVAGSWA